MGNWLCFIPVNFLLSVLKSYLNLHRSTFLKLKFVFAYQLDRATGGIVGCQTHYLLMLAKD